MQTSLGRTTLLKQIQNEKLDLVPALGFIELNSIARGLFLTDLILKKAPVSVITSQPVSSGKHVILYFGDVASVEESHKEAMEFHAGCLVKEVFIPGVHEALAPYLDSLWSNQPRNNSYGDSLGIVESSSLAGAILSADRALKMADVSLCRMQLGQGIGGKAYFIVSGRLEEVEASIEAAELCLKEYSSLGRVDLIQRPIEEVLDHF